MKDPGVDKADYISYLDDLASFIGVKPNIPLLFITDPRLAWEVFFGPYSFTSIANALEMGWSPNAILTQWDRTLKPGKLNHSCSFQTCSSASHYLKAWGAPILLASLLLIYKIFNVFETGARKTIGQAIPLIYWVFGEDKLMGYEDCPQSY